MTGKRMHLYRLQKDVALIRWIALRCPAYTSLRRSIHLNELLKLIVLIVWCAADDLPQVCMSLILYAGVVLMSSYLKSAALASDYVTSVRVSSGSLMVLAPILYPCIRCGLWFRTIVNDAVG